MGAMVIYISGKTGFGIIAGACVIVLAFIPLYITTEHLSSRGWHITITTLAVLALITIVVQNFKQAREDNERDERDREVLSYLKQIAQNIEKKG